MQSKSLQKGNILFSKDSSSFFYDLKINDSLFLFLDKINDTIIRAYSFDKFSEPLFTFISAPGREKLQKPIFTKEVLDMKEWNNKTFLIDNNNLFYKSLTLNKEKNKAEILTLSMFDTNNIHSTDFNILQKNIYAIPVNRKTDSPYYIFNSNTGYRWAEPSVLLKENFSDNPWAYTNTICLNENYNSVVSAFRFTNYILFYNLDGLLKTTVKFGENLIKPKVSQIYKNIDVEKSVKCFTYICGTPNYVYCLYDGSLDFSNSSKILVFQWDGKHIKTWQADKNLRAITVDNKDKYILAIASNYQNGQDIVKYNLIDQ